jgi:hypothetical protein
MSLLTRSEDAAVLELLTQAAWTSLTALLNPPTYVPSTITEIEINRSVSMFAGGICVDGYDLAFGFNFYPFTEFNADDVGLKWPVRDIASELRAAGMTELLTSRRQAKFFATPEGLSLIAKEGFALKHTSAVVLTSTGRSTMSALTIRVSQDELELIVSFEECRSPGGMALALEYTG